MAEYFTTAGVCQPHITKVYQNWGKRLSVPHALHDLYTAGKYTSVAPPPPHTGDWRYLTPEEFTSNLSRLTIEINHIIIHQVDSLQHDNQSSEESTFPQQVDVLSFKAFNFVADPEHLHDFFELVYMYHGQCSYQLGDFQQELTLKKGQFLIIAPQTKHRLTINDPKAVVIVITIRKSTFQETFFGLLQGEGVLTHFFHSILTRSGSPNYLLFTTQGERPVRELIQSLVGESSLGDQYANSCSAGLLSQFFTYLLRHYSQSLQFANYDFLSPRFPLLMQYIQQHYRNLTLKALAEAFHYSETYLSTLIHENSGQTFSHLLTELKISEACRLLKHSAMSIGEIASATGYSSAVHFSRTFHKVRGISPQGFRKAYLEAATQGCASLLPR